MGREDGGVVCRKKSKQQRKRLYLKGATDHINCMPLAKGCVEPAKLKFELHSLHMVSIGIPPENP